MGIPLAELGERITAEEFRGWCDFFVDYPFDDIHRFHRPAALLASCSFRAPPVDKALGWLCPEPDPAADHGDLSDADKTTMRTFRKLMKGRG